MQVTMSKNWKCLRSRPPEKASARENKCNEEVCEQDRHYTVKAKREEKSLLFGEAGFII